MRGPTSWLYWGYVRTYYKNFEGYVFLHWVTLWNSSNYSTGGWIALHYSRERPISLCVWPKFPTLVINLYYHKKSRLAAAHAITIATNSRWGLAIPLRLMFHRCSPHTIPTQTDAKKWRSYSPTTKARALMPIRLYHLCHVDRHTLLSRGKPPVNLWVAQRLLYVKKVTPLRRCGVWGFWMTRGGWAKSLNTLQTYNFKSHVNNVSSETLRDRTDLFVAEIPD